MGGIWTANVPQVAADFANTQVRSDFTYYPQETIEMSDQGKNMPEASFCHKLFPVRVDSRASQEILEYHF